MGYTSHALWTVRRVGFTCGAALVLLGALAWDSLPAQSQDEGREEISSTPLPTDIIEETGVSLVLLDVEVRDEEGRPIPGLTRDDFTVILNGSRRPIYSVDDFCEPAPATPLVAEGETAGRPSVAEGDPAASRPATAEESPTPPATGRQVRIGAKVPKFILYFDFSQFRGDGRANALDAAERWVRETMQPGEQAQLVAHTVKRRLEPLTGFTSDKDLLLSVIEKVRPDMAYHDSFREESASKIRCCSGLGPVPCLYPAVACKAWAWEDHLHTKRSLEALKAYLVGLDTVPGRKALLLFHQGCAIFPSRKYAISETRVGDEVDLLDQVGAEANLSSTAVFPTYTGNSQDSLASTGINFGANLADFTGGDYNRGDVDLDSFMTRAGREFGCMYRIGIEKPERSRARIYRAKILVREKALASRYRVRFLDATDRWWRKAQAVLTAPERAGDVQLHAAVMPLTATDKGWDLRVQVAIDLDSLALIPYGTKQRADWEVGALLSRHDGSIGLEMLGVSRVRTKGNELQDATFVVHQRRFEGLPHGTYRFAAFARDRGANLFGGDQGELELPRLRKPGLAGPFLRLASRKHLEASLPRLTKKRPEGAKKAKVRTGAVPASGDGISPGDDVELVSFVCPGSKGDRPGSDELLRFVTRGDEALFRLEDAKLEGAGKCFRLADTVETAALDPGVYAYNVRWSRDGEDEPLESSIRFRITGSSRAAGATRPPGGTVELAPQRRQ